MGPTLFEQNQKLLDGAEKKNYNIKMGHEMKMWLIARILVILKTISKNEKK